MPSSLVVISLGWGVQSFALACMSALEVLPKADAAVHGDTGWERPETYRLAEKWTPWLEERGVRVVTVQAKKQHRDIFNGAMNYSPPFFVRGPRGWGQLGRHCTNSWKRYPVQRWISAKLLRMGVKKTPNVVDLWLGITLDEVERMRESRVKYINNTFPFITMFERPWDRAQVKMWLADNNLDIPVKSSCVFCPYRDKATWRDIQLNYPECWSRAVELDERVRHMKDDYLCYIYNKGNPLADIDFRSAVEMGQLTLWEAEECSGMCFL